ncbi:hypothetical protein GCM10011529_06450 [Polymorphobacter glacialis]|uniref:ABC transporter substrate-binding protein n=1 Tax=Sandarakinorhabdus glacialis TaxID=1614636 RepID=A0A916ZKV2_9SPHN|nr:hypothetical protein [Polymorphobacter glacialis]GGE02688.1 hypothetical protein GCM10011529_06450 [Polymorphobacter glacialis]
MQTFIAAAAAILFSFASISAATIDLGGQPGSGLVVVALADTPRFA